MFECKYTYIYMHVYVCILQEFMEKVGASLIHGQGLDVIECERKGGAKGRR